MTLSQVLFIVVGINVYIHTCTCGWVRSTSTTYVMQWVLPRSTGSVCECLVRCVPPAGLVGRVGCTVYTLRGPQGKGWCSGTRWHLVICGVAGGGGAGVGGTAHLSTL